MSILLFVVEALFVGVTALLSFVLAISFIMDLLLVFASFGLSITILTDNPTVGLIIAIIISISFYLARHAEFIEKTMMVITSILLGILAFFCTNILGDILLSVVNAVVAIVINVLVRIKLGYD